MRFLEKINLRNFKSKLNFLKIIIKTAIDLDDKLCERAMERRYFERQSKDYILYRVHGERISSKRNERNNSDNSKIVPMK